MCVSRSLLCVSRSLLCVSRSLLCVNRSLLCVSRSSSRVYIDFDGSNVMIFGRPLLLQKSSIRDKRALQGTKESYQRQKSPIKDKRDLAETKESYKRQKSPIKDKRDLQKRPLIECTLILMAAM